MNAFDGHQYDELTFPKIMEKLDRGRVPTWKDKLVQEVVRSILEAYYEPQFSDSSHGFRPERGCHTALTTIEPI
ncbi:hypothetical protein [Microcoleus sp. D3_18a_C4]|uniref:hypothetical protein n=1 Tax=unclassified Microcoleus TaxID=2642155 RepID=UPI00198DEEBF|nr:hypothetical protein [Microcoleus sp. T1-bin1]